MIVPAAAAPISTLYLTRQTEVNVLYGGAVTDAWAIVDGEFAIAVDETVRTAGWGYCCGVAGREFALDGTPTGVTYGSAQPTTYDGTTDGNYNYGVSYSSGDVYRYSTDWTNPQLLYTTWFYEAIGITYDPADNSLWLLQHHNGDVNGTQVQHWSMDGTMLGSFSTGRDYTLSLALDPASSSLWFWDRSHYDYANGYYIGELVEFSREGTQLSSQAFNGEYVYGAEFSRVPEPASLLFVAMGGVGLFVRRRRMAAQVAPLEGGSAVVPDGALRS